LEEFISCAFPDSNVIWDARRSVEFRSRKVSEGMEVYAVDGSSNEAENQLCQVSSYFSDELQRI